MDQFENVFPIDIKSGDIIAVQLNDKNSNTSVKINQYMTKYEKYELINENVIQNINIEKTIPTYLCKMVINKNNHKQLCVDYITKKYDTTVHTNQFRIHIQLYANSIDKLEELY